MPSYNVKNYIVECLDSVVNQTLSDIEIILIDAGSTDGTVEILNEYADKDSRIKLLHSDKKSYGYQMNMGISEAKGQYIGIVETDDYVDLEMFKTLYDLSNDGECDMVKSSFIYVNEDTGEVYKDKNIYKLQIPDDRVFNLKDNAYILTGHPSIWAAIYKREFLLTSEIKFMEEPYGGWVDNPFFHETAILASSIRYTNEAYYYYRESNPDSSSNQLTDFTLPIKRMLDNLDVLDKYPQCKSKDVLKAVYWRVNVYMNNIQSRDAFMENLPLVRPYIHEMMERLDLSIVLEYFSVKDQERYFEFLTEFDTLKEGDVIEVPSNEYVYLERERGFLKFQLNKKIEEIDKLKAENKKLKNVKNYKAEYDSILNSSSWKITKPLRSFKRIFKK